MSRQEKADNRRLTPRHGGSPAASYGQISRKMRGIAFGYSVPLVLMWWLLSIPSFE
jgi:hypothetical protein